MRQLLLALVVVTGTTGTTLARAEPQRTDKAAAEALFSEGRKLMQEGRYSEACPKFEASQRIDPGIGTMLNLAECYEKIGRTASAWAEFREVVSAARAAESREREELARQRAQALEAALSRLTIRLAPANETIVGLEVRRDGAVVDHAEFGSAIPVDPGKHVIEATAPGKQKWLQSIDVGGSGASVTIEIPALGPAADEADSIVRTSGSFDARPVERGANTGKTLAVVVGAAGLFGVGVGTYFGLSASSTWSDAKDACGAYPYECGARGKDLEEDARSKATVSTIGFIAGAVGLGVGTVLWFTSGSDSGAHTDVGVGPGNVMVRGRF